MLSLRQVVFLMVVFCISELFVSVNAQGKSPQLQNQTMVNSSTVPCDKNPIIICPPNLTLCPNADIHPNGTGCAKARSGGPHCEAPNVEYIDRITSEGPCKGEKVIQRIWIAVDPQDPTLRSFCIQYIYLEDKHAPNVLLCPKDTTILSNEKCHILYHWIAPSFSDHCSNFCIQSTHPNGSTFSIGNTKVELTASDDCGNTATCVFNVNVLSNCCNKPPIITCPADYYSCPQDADPKITGIATAIASSVHCGIPIIEYYDDTLVFSQCSVSIHRTWKAFDPDNHSLHSTCVQKIEMNDVVKPIISCPPNLTVKTDADCKALVKWIDPTVSDNCSSVKLISSHQPNNRFDIGVYTIYYTAVDACGNEAGCSFTLTVEANCCNVPPVIICPNDFSSCPQGIDPAVTGRATTLKGNKYCTTPEVSYVDQLVFSGPCSTYVERIWTALDPIKTLSTSCTQVLNLFDTLGPGLSVPQDITVPSGFDCMAIVTWNPPLASDNCTSSTIESNYTSGDKFPIGTTVVNVSAKDACGNTSFKKFTITVTDNCCELPPIINCPADYKACPGSSIDPSITGRPNVNPGSTRCTNPILSYKDELVSNNTCTTIIRRTWMAVDSFRSELNSRCVQLIELKDTIPPKVTCPTDIKILSTDSCVVEVYWNEPSITDNCSSTFRFDQSHESGAIFGIGKRTIYYSIFDACGNLAGCNFEVEVIDNCCKSNPIIICPPNFVDCPNGSIEPLRTGQAIVQNDAHCKDPIINYIDEIINTNDCKMLVKRTWTAVDSFKAELNSSCIQFIELKDTIPPKLICPTGIKILSNENCVAKVFWNEPTVTDNCSSSYRFDQSHQNGTTFNVGNRTIYYSAFDSCGNVGGCSFEVEVVANCCNVGPTISCPSDFKGCPGTIEPTRTGTATATKGNALCVDPMISHRDVIVHQANCSLAIERTWLAVDPNNSNFRDSCVQRIELKDDSKPLILNCPNDIEVRPNTDCNTIVNWNIPTATDNCELLSLSGTHMPGIQLGVGKIKVVYTATDACSNTSTCIFNIEVLNECCNKPPVLICPADYKGCPNTSIAKEITGQASVTKGTPYCNNPIVTFTDRVLSTGPCKGAITIERTWAATDPDFSNYNVTCKQRIELVDNTPPVIEPIADLKINAMGQCEIKVTLPKAQVTDYCGLLSITSDKVSGSIFNMGTTRVTYTAIDSCGNSSTRSFNVIVEGSVISIDCPKDTMIYRVNPYLVGAYYSWPIPKVRHCAPCKDSISGFIYMGEYAGNRYFCSLTPATWNDAKILCKLNGGDLAKITSAEENHYISSKLMGQTAWIGASDERREGVFEWIDRALVSYSNWASGQPNNGGGNEDYVELQPNGLWNDNSENVSREFICQIPCYKITQTEGPKSGSLLPCGNNKITFVAEKDGKRDTCSYNVKVDCDSISKYCNNGGQYTDILWIDRVSLASINNVSGDNNGYAYFNTPCTSLSNGIEYELCVEPGYKTTAYVVYWKIWIDYNQDGVFQTRELFLTGQGSTGLCGRFTLPSSIISGQTRMRVVMSYGKHVSDACGFILYGEVEDYCIDLRKIGTTIGAGALQQRKLPIEMKCFYDCETKNKSDEIEVREQSFQFINSIEVIPNPVVHEMQLLSKGRNVKVINIYNSAGKIVYKKIAPISNKELLNVSQWNDGMYFVSVEFDDQSLVVEKFLIQK